MQVSAFITAGIIGLATFASQFQAFQARFNPVPESQRAAHSQQLAIDAFQLTDGQASGFRQLTPRSNSVYRQGQQIDIYIEPRGLATRFEDRHIRAFMSIDLEVRNGAGRLVSRAEAAWKLPYAIASDRLLPLTNMFAAFSTTPLTLEPGPYTLTLRIKDDLAGSSVDRSFTIMVEAEQPRDRVVGVGGGLAARDGPSLR